MAIPDATSQVNEPRLRAIVGNVVNLGSRTYTDADVRALIFVDDKQRFEISEAGTHIRAAQGHTMAGIADVIGELLTLEAAPLVAVHGSYLESLERILSNGLNRMSRHHVHLAKGLLGEAGVISGMRRNAELFIWVNVRDAIRDGLRFFESANGVILGDGRDGDGIIPAKYFSVIIELRGGLRLRPAQVRLLQRAFAGCSRVTVTKLHGGFSGSLVLKTDAYGADGSREEPSVTKLDFAYTMMDEVKRTRSVGELIGESATQVVRGPLVADASGSEKQEFLRALELIDEKIDGPLGACLQNGDIRILRCSWLSSEESNASLDRDDSGAVLLKRMQELPQEAFYSPAEAADLLLRGDRSILVLSQCWQTALHPVSRATTVFKPCRATVSCRITFADAQSSVFCGTTGPTRYHPRHRPLVPCKRHKLRDVWPVLGLSVFAAEGCGRQPTNAR